MLFVGNDWAEDHHDVEIVDDQGRRLARRRLPEGLEGIHQAACVDRTVRTGAVGRVGAWRGALLRRAEVGRLDSDAALELLTAHSAIASSSNAMRIRSHMGKSAVTA